MLFLLIFSLVFFSLAGLTMWVYDVSQDPSLLRWRAPLPKLHPIDTYGTCILMPSALELNPSRTCPNSLQLPPKSLQKSAGAVVSLIVHVSLQIEVKWSTWQKTLK